MDVDNKLEKDADQIVDEIDRKAQPKKVQVVSIDLFIFFRKKLLFFFLFANLMIS